MGNNSNLWKPGLFPPGAGEREEGFCHLDTIPYQVNTSNTVVAEYSFDAWGRRRNPTDWSYNVSGQLFADRGFTGHEYLPWYNLLNMNGRLYDPLVGRFLNADPYIQDAGFTQSYNRYSYCLNNPLKYTDPTGEKWKWKYLNPFYWFETGMQALNDNTVKLREKMVEIGVPDFNVSTSVNGAGNVNVKGSYKGQEVFNTGNIDRSNAVQVVNEKIAQVRQDYGAAWHAANGGGSDWTYGAGYSLTGSGMAFNALQNTVTSGDMWLGNNGKYYSNTWSGNQYTGSRAGAFKAAGMYKMAGRANVAATVIIGGVSVYNGYQQDGGQFGYNANRAGAAATGGVIGGWAGAEAGAAIGAGIGVWFGGVGAVPGAIIGGVAGGFIGSFTGNAVGAEAVDYYYGR